MNARASGFLLPVGGDANVGQKVGSAVVSGKGIDVLQADRLGSPPPPPASG